MNHTLLQKVALLNAKRDTPNRYQLISEFTRTKGEPRKVALVKYIGKQTLNVSGWRSPKELAAFLDGWFDGWDTHTREINREVRQHISQNRGGIHV